MLSFPRVVLSTSHTMLGVPLLRVTNVSHIKETTDCHCTHTVLQGDTTTLFPETHGTVQRFSSLNLIKEKCLIVITHV